MAHRPIRRMGEPHHQSNLQCFTGNKDLRLCPVGLSTRRFNPTGRQILGPGKMSWSQIFIGGFPGRIDRCIKRCCCYRF